MIGDLINIVGKFIPDKDKAKELEATIQKAHTEAISKIKMEQSKIIQEEQKNGSGSWRPLLMKMCMLMIFIHYILQVIIPYIIVVSGLNVYYPQIPELSSELWGFLRLGIGGYIGARSLEKIAVSTVSHFRGK